MGSTVKVAHLTLRRFTVVVSLAVLSMLFMAGGASTADPPHYCQVRPATQLGPIVCIGQFLSFEALAGFAPRALPRAGRAPIAFHLEGKVRVGSGHPPSLEELTLELDKHAVIDVTEFPTCGGSIVRSGIEPARRLCGDAIVGAGQARIETEDQGVDASHFVTLPLTIFNGGKSGGVSKLLFQFEAIPPSRAPVMAIGESRLEEKGRLGTRMSVAFPRFEEGNGSITRFGFGLRRRTPGGAPGIMRAACPDRRLLFRAFGLFHDGSRAGGSSVRSCVPTP